ncbi:MAG: 50S ribosomal protein L32 [Chloroflexota bacterium]
MAAHPKKKISHSNQGARRSHLALRKPSLAACPQCRTLRPHHQVCPRCGTYRGRQVLAIKAKRTATR